MESWKKFSVVLVTMAVLLTATMPPMATATLVNIFHVKGNPDAECVPKYEFCLFAEKECCGNCTCYGVCIPTNPVSVNLHIELKMESWKKFGVVLVTMALVLATTLPPMATAARKEAVALLVDSSSTTALANIFDVKGKPDANCIPKYEFCLFAKKECCGNCTCFGLCIPV
ncbi:hypothetical protein Gotur_033133 [Gossypium turneri]